MAIRDRQTLKSHFQNGAIPTAQHYGHLIDSMLNKWDDKFHGRWRPGIEYREGDVVIWCKTMYMLVNPDPQPTPAKSAKSVEPTTEPIKIFKHCSNLPPTEDKLHWCQLQFDFEDKDWKINDAEGYIYAHPVTAKKVGIGVNQGTVGSVPVAPGAILHVYQEKIGEFKFNPDGSDRVEFRMEAFDLPDCDAKPYWSQWLDKEYAHAETNASKGFSFEHINPANPGQTDASKLMVVTGENDKPEVGIGTETPTATLQVSDADKSDFQVNPSENPQPELRLTNLQPGQDLACLSTTVDKDFASLTTNADHGFRFAAKAEPLPQVQAKYASNGANPAEVVVVSTDGKLGIGTEQPKARLDVTDQISGAFQVCLDRPNPSIAILNLEATPEKSTVFAAGVDDTAAILQTDAPCGFVFRQAQEPGLNAKADLDLGEDLVWIDQQGNLGVGRPPLGYQADIHGAVRQFENYVPLNKNTMDNLRPLNKALDIVCGLHPVRFVWKNNLDGKLTKGDHFGLRDTNVEQAASEICKTVTSGATKEKSINMLELVPVLIKAIQEQQEQIKNLETKLAALGGKHY